MMYNRKEDFDAIGKRYKKPFLKIIKVAPKEFHGIFSQLWNRKS